MKNKKLLAIILLSLSFCFVSGVGYGKVVIPPQSVSYDELVLYGDEPLFGMIESLRKDIGRLKLQNGLLEARINYMMRNPTVFLEVDFFYDRTGAYGVAGDLPESANTKGKIYVLIIDTRNVFSYKTGVVLLEQFKRLLDVVIYSFIDDIATDMDADVVVKLYSGEGIPLAYFCQGEYHLWED